MPNEDLLIRAGLADDIPALTDLFNHYIEHTNARFTTELMTPESCRTWFGGYGAGRYRLLVAQDASGVLGAAYSSRYRPSSAFDRTVETSI
jgi:phosphinothricin acetyltransferase